MPFILSITLKALQSKEKLDRPTIPPVAMVASVIRQLVDTKLTIYQVLGTSSILQKHILGL